MRRPIGITGCYCFIGETEFLATHVFFLPVVKIRCLNLEKGNEFQDIVTASLVQLDIALITGSGISSKLCIRFPFNTINDRSQIAAQVIDIDTS